jgi:hypothetical protein
MILSRRPSTRKVQTRPLAPLVPETLVLRLQRAHVMNGVSVLKPRSNANIPHCTPASR